MPKTNPITVALNNVKPANVTERAIKDDLLKHNKKPQLDDLLSHIECTYHCTEDGLNTNPDSSLNYTDGINFLTKYNLMPD